MTPPNPECKHNYGFTGMGHMPWCELFDKPTTPSNDLPKELIKLESIEAANPPESWVKAFVKFNQDWKDKTNEEITARIFKHRMILDYKKEALDTCKALDAKDSLSAEKDKEILELKKTLEEWRVDCAGWKKDASDRAEDGRKAKEIITELKRQIGRLTIESGTVIEEEK